MAKWFGKIGFGEDEAVDDYGVWKPSLTYKEYYGDLLKDYHKRDSTSNVNDNLSLGNSISILADPYVSQNLGKIRCVEYGGTYWKVTSVDVQYPRLVLSVGPVYNIGSTGGAG